MTPWWIIASFVLRILYLALRSPVGRWLEEPAPEGETLDYVDKVGRKVYKAEER